MAQFEAEIDYSKYRMVYRSREGICRIFGLAPPHFDLLIASGDLPAGWDSWNPPRWKELQVALAIGNIHHRVYFISMAAFIKIGISYQLSWRLKGFETSLPMPITLLHDILGGPKTEEYLHAKFAAHRTRGEWFNDSPEIRAYIDTLKVPK